MPAWWQNEGRPAGISASVSCCLHIVNHRHPEDETLLQHCLKLQYLSESASFHLNDTAEFFYCSWEARCIKKYPGISSQISIFSKLLSVRFRHLWLTLNLKHVCLLFFKISEAFMKRKILYSEA